MKTLKVFSVRFFTIIILLTSSIFVYGQANILISQGGTVSVNNGDMFYDAGGAASVDGNTGYTITLCPAVAGEMVCLDFTYFKTMFSGSAEDALFIYDGITATGNDIGKLMGDFSVKTSGSTTPYGMGRGNTNSADANNIFKPTLFSATNSTGCLTLKFVNQSSSTNPGWVATIYTYKPLGLPGCHIALSATPTTICTGQSSTLTAIGDIVASSLNNDFNGTTVGTGWVGSPAATVVTNVCSSPSLDGSKYLWMQNFAFPRSLESLPMDVSLGGTISFEYRQAKFNSDPSPCEGPDITMSGTTNEGIFVQYSVDNGTTWNTFKYVYSNSLYSNSASADVYNNGCGDYVTRWTKMTYPIPTAAKTATTKFRWIQPVGTGTGAYDNWGLDNVIVSSPKPWTITIKNMTAAGTPTVGTSTTSPYNLTVSPTVTTTYRAIIALNDNSQSCYQDITVNVNQLTVNTSSTPTSCGASVGTVTATASNGTAPYTYTWPGPITGGTISNLAAGSYTVTASDVNGCSQTGTATVTGTGSTVVAPTSATATPSSICPSYTGNISLSATGGNGTTCKWYTGSCGGTLIGSGATISIPAPASNTTYYVRWEDACGNSSCQTATVSFYTAPTVTVTSPTICSGATATMTASGASTYTWSAGLGTGNPKTASPSTTATYSVVGTDANGCTASAVSTVNVNVLPTVTVNSQTICLGTNATLTANGANTYSWSSGLGTGNPKTVSPTVTTTYAVTGTDANGCTKSAVSTVTLSTSLSVSVTSPTICNGGTATLTAAGASTYAWTAGLGAGNPKTVSPTATTTYSVTGTDASGCTGAAIATVTVNPLPTVSVTSPTICSGATATMTASGASSYSWSAGLGAGNPKTANPTTTTTYSVTGTDANGCTANAVSTITVNPLPIPDAGNNTSVCNGLGTSLTASGGTSYLWSTTNATATINVSPTTTTVYTVTVTNSATGCSATDNVTVSVNQKPTVAISAAPSNICQGQTTQLTATGAATYKWNDNSTSNVLSVTPSVGTTSYTVTGTDGNGCTNTATVGVNVQASITVNVNPPSICVGQSATISASGGVSYLWNTSAVTPSITISPVTTTTYSVTVTDNVCTATATAVLTVNPLPVVTMSNNQAICPGATATISATTTASTPTYLWNNTQTLNQINVSPAINTTYTVTVTDANGCAKTNQVAVVINPLPSANAGTDKTICFGTSTTLTASGGVSYLWNTTANTATTAALSPATTTSYTVTATNAQGCTDDDIVVINVNSLPIASAGSNVSICPGESTMLTATGGTTYSWSNLVNAQTINVTPTITTTYTVTATQNGCTDTEVVTVTVNPAAVASVTSALSNVCTGNSTNLTATGGVTYAWSNNETDDIITVFPTTNVTYTVTVTDANGCTDTESVSLTVSGITAIPNPSSLCLGNSTTISVSGGNQYDWSTNEHTQQITVSPVVSSTYTVTVSDAFGCSASASIPVTVYPLPTFDLGANPTICSGSSTTITAPIVGTYSWSNTSALSSITVSPSVTTTFTLTVTDSHTCSASDNITVNVNQTPTANAGPDQDICLGSTAQLNASGGTVYTWNTTSELSAANIFNPIASPLGTSVYTVTVSANGCFTVDHVTINVNPIPTAFAGFDQSICAGTSTILTAVGGDQYDWSNGSNTATTSVEPTVQTTYTVTVTSSGCSSTDNLVVSLINLPVVSFTSDTNQGCEPLLITFTDGTVPSAASYLWSFGDGGSSILANTQHLYTTDGVFDVTLTVISVEGCTSSFTNNNMITVHAQPTVDFSWDPEVGDVFAGNINFTSITTGGASEYLWNFADTVSSSNTSVDVNTSHIYVSSGNYNVMLTASTAEGCWDTVTHVIKIKDVTAFYIPNAFTPTGNDLNEIFIPIFFNMDFETYEFSVYDRWGDRVFSTNNPLVGWNGKVRDSSKKAKSDIYIWKVVYKAANNKLTEEIGNFMLVD